MAHHTHLASRVSLRPAVSAALAFSCGVALLLAAPATLEAQSVPTDRSADPSALSLPSELVPEGAWVAMGWRGAAALEPAFLSTGLGEVIAEPRVQELSTLLHDALDGLLREKVDDPDDRAGLLFAREAAELLWSRPMALAFTGLDLSGHEPRPELTFCLHAGEKARTIFDAIENLREGEGVPAEPHPSAAHARRVRLPDDSSSLTYGIERGHFFAAIGDGAAEAILGRIRGETAPLGRTANFTAAAGRTVGESRPAAWLFVDAPHVLEAVKTHLAASDAALPPPVVALLKDDALGRLGPVMGMVGIEESGFRRALSIGWRGENPPAPTLDDETLALVPRDTSFFSYEDCDLAGIVRTLREFAEGIDPDLARNIRNMKAVADGFLGFRIEEDFLANLGRRFLAFEEPTTSGLIPGLCFVLQPQDGETLETCVRRVTTSLGALARMQGAEVTIREHGKISTIETAGFPNPLVPSWATHGERLLLALHPTVLEEVLHRVEGAGSVERSILANPDFIAARGRMHENLHGVFYTDTPDVVASVYPTVLPALQAGISMLGREVPSLRAAQLPPPFMVNERMFGDIHGYHRDADGWHWEAHGPFPFTVMDYGSDSIFFLSMVGTLAGVAMPRMVEARDQAMAIEVRAAERAAERVHEIVAVHDAYAERVADALMAHAREHGNFPATLLDLGLPGDVLETDGRALWVYAGALGRTPENRILFHSARPHVESLFLSVDTEGDQELLTKEELEQRVKDSNWPRRTRL